MTTEPQSQIAVGNGKRRNLISLTPLIDVVFILLVFFMLASNFMEWRAISLDTVKAPAKSKSKSEQKVWILEVSEDLVEIEGQKLQPSQVAEHLKTLLAEKPDGIVRIKPVRDTSLQTVVDMLAILKASEVQNMSLLRDNQWQVPEASAPKDKNL